MHRNRRSLLDYTPAEPQQNDRVYASENQHVKRGDKESRPQQRRGLKSLMDVSVIRQKIQEKIKSDEPGNQQDDIAVKSTPNHAPVREQSSYSSDEQQKYYHDPDKPLLDFVAIIMSVWRRKFLIVALAFIGGIIGVLVALSTPHTYYAESEIFLDPRELRLTDTDLSNNPVSSDLLLALVDTQMRVATSTTVLQNTIDELGLASDPEFNGKSSGFGKGLVELFSSSSSDSPDINKRVLEQLRKSIGVGRDPKTLVVSLGVSTRSAEKSALIANSIVEQFLREFSLQKSGFFNQTSSSIQERIDILRTRLDGAENAIVKYRSANDIIDVGGGVINQKEMLSLSDSLTKIRSDQIAKSILAEELSKVDVNAVISGSFPQAALTNTLSDQRKQYSVAKSTSDSLAVGLGPRHPKLVAAQASVKALETDIRDELRRIIAAAQRDAKRTQQSEAELSSQLAVLKSRSSDLSVENIELEDLMRKANSLRSLYEQLLKSSSETAVQGELSSSKIQVISRAESPDVPSSTSRKITVILFAFIGGMLGLTYAMIIGAWTGIQQNYTSRSPATNKRAALPENSPTPEATAPQQRHYEHQEPVMQQPLQASPNNGYAVSGMQGHIQAQAQAQAQTYGATQGQMYSPAPMTEMQGYIPSQAYPDPRMVPMPTQVPTHQAPLPQAGYFNGQPSPIYPNVMPHPAAQHVFVQSTEQEMHPQAFEPHAQKGMPPAQENEAPKSDSSEEYQRLHNEVQRVRSRLENWVSQNNRDSRNR